MIAYLGEDPGEFTENFYKQRVFSKMDGYKITIQKSVTFMYTTNSSKIKWKYLIYNSDKN